MRFFRKSDLDEDSLKIEFKKEFEYVEMATNILNTHNPDQLNLGNATFSNLYHFTRRYEYVFFSKYIENLSSKNTNISTNVIEQRAKIGDDVFYKSTYLYITGHGNISLTDKEVIILREHLLAGAFLHADDNYGMDKSFRREMSKVFPDKSWVELPPNHQIFNNYFTMPNGLPKIHEHDNKRPQALGLFDNDRLIVLYTYESDLGDGWEDIGVHNNPQTIRNSALEMGTNIIIYALNR